MVANDWPVCWHIHELLHWCTTNWYAKVWSFAYYLLPPDEDDNGQHLLWLFQQTCLHQKQNELKPKFWTSSTQITFLVIVPDILLVPLSDEQRFIAVPTRQTRIQIHSMNVVNFKLGQLRLSKTECWNKCIQVILTYLILVRFEIDWWQLWQLSRWGFKTATRMIQRSSVIFMQTFEKKLRWFLENVISRLQSLDHGTIHFCFFWCCPGIMPKNQVRFSLLNSQNLFETVVAHWNVNCSSGHTKAVYQWSCIPVSIIMLANLFCPVVCVFWLVTTDKGRWLASRTRSPPTTLPNVQGEFLQNGRLAVLFSKRISHLIEELGICFACKQQPRQKVNKTSSSGDIHLNSWASNS